MLENDALLSRFLFIGAEKYKEALKKHEKRLQRYMVQENCGVAYTLLQPSVALCM